MQNHYPQIDSSEAGKLTADDQIDLACDAFESAFRRGSNPTIESFIEQAHSSQRGRLIAELLLVQSELQHGISQLDWDYYSEKFPEYSDQIETARFRSHENNESENMCVTGRKINRFHLQKKIGSGSTGEVWKVWDPRIRRQVALKITHAGQMGHDTIDQFLREARTTGQLSHPGIVQVHEVGREGSAAYIVSSLIAGEDLRVKLSKQQLSFREAAELCLQLADALHHAHERGIVHRDLKPGNVIIDDNGRPYITDFGLAKWLDGDCDTTIAGLMLGTPAYMSPEQARGDSALADRRTDVYTLGVLLYELLTGRRPLTGDPKTFVHQILSVEPLSPRRIIRDIPQDLETICLKAISKSPAHRYASALDLAVDLKRFLHGDAILARRQSTWERMLRTARRHPAPTLAAILAVVSLIAFGIIGRLTAENRALLGLKNVEISTQPPGAEITFVPIDETTGEIQSTNRIVATGLTPVRQDLVPGHYLVVAVLPSDDNAPKFHEVSRYVPHDKNELPGTFRHNRWHTRADGTVELPEVVIPPPEVINGMALVSCRRQGAGNYSFFMDCDEFTVQQHVDLFNGELPKDRRWKPVPLSCPLTVSYDRAMAIAESVGKRLPTDAEFEQALRCQEQRALTETQPSIGQDQETRKPERAPPFEVPIVNGLSSSVAEWTSTPASMLNTDRAEIIAPLPFTLDQRIVRGRSEQAIREGNEPPTVATNGNCRRIAVERHMVAPGLGFRCVRSAQPRFVEVLSSR